MNRAVKPTLAGAWKEFRCRKALREHVMVKQAQAPRRSTGGPTYERWMESRGIPIYRGHFVADPMTLELGNWDERECKACFIQLEGQQGVSEARITEIGAGDSLPPNKMAVSEVVYVLE